MEEEISSFVELRITVKRTEHECDDRKGNGNTDNRGEFKDPDLVRVLFQQYEDQLNKRDNAAEHIGQHSIELEVLEP